MDVNMNVLANGEASRNKQNINQQILQKTLEKTAEIKQQQAGEPRVVNKAQGKKQGGIDVYA